MFPELRSFRAPGMLPLTAMTSAPESPLILIVDDAPDARYIYSVYLTHHGYRVLEAGDGEAALRMAIEHRPALVLMDLGMPRMDGWEATRRIKANPETAQILVLALSGHAFADSIGRAKDAGVDAFFIKPVMPATILAKVREMLALGEAGAM